MAIKSLSPNPPCRNLEELAWFIWGNEVVCGQASKIGNDGTETVVIFDNVHIPEATDDACRVAVVTGNAQPPGSHSFLCSGRAFIDGTKSQVSVYRI